MIENISLEGLPKLLVGIPIHLISCYNSFKSHINNRKTTRSYYNPKS